MHTQYTIKLKTHVKKNDLLMLTDLTPSNRWFEVYITYGLDKYYEKTTILGIFI